MSSGIEWRQQSCFGSWPGSLWFQPWRLQPPNRIRSESNLHSHLHSSALRNFSEIFPPLYMFFTPIFTHWWCACRGMLQLKATPKILAFAQRFCVLEKRLTESEKKHYFIFCFNVKRKTIAIWSVYTLPFKSLWKVCGWYDFLHVFESLLLTTAAFILLEIQENYEILLQF